MAGNKDIEGGIVILVPYDKSTLKQMYPMTAASCDMFEAAHPCLAEEMHKDPAQYIKTLDEKARDFCKDLLNQTQLFHRYFELASYIGGLLTYQEVHIEILKDKLKETKEKLSRYEDND